MGSFSASRLPISSSSPLWLLHSWTFKAASMRSPSFWMITVSLTPGLPVGQTEKRKRRSAYGKMKGKDCVRKRLTWIHQHHGWQQGDLHFSQSKADQTACKFKDVPHQKFFFLICRKTESEKKMQLTARISRDLEAKERETYWGSGRHQEGGNLSQKWRCQCPHQRQNTTLKGPLQNSLQI